MWGGGGYEWLSATPAPKRMGASGLRSPKLVRRNLGAQPSTGGQVPPLSRLSRFPTSARRHRSRVRPGKSSGDLRGSNIPIVTAEASSAPCCSLKKTRSVLTCNALPKAGPGGRTAKLTLKGFGHSLIWPDARASSHIPRGPTPSKGIT